MLPRPSDVPPEPATSAVEQPPPEAHPLPDKEQIPRITIPLTADGAPLWSRMREETKGKVLTFLKAHGAPPEADGPTFDPLVISAVYEALGALAVLAAVTSGHTKESSAQMRLTDEEKKILTPVTQKVLAKYGQSIVKYQDEAALALVLYSVFQGKIAKLERVPRPGVVTEFPQRSPEQPA